MPSPLTGPAGEYFVLFRLLEKGYVAGLAPRNAPNSDIIATNIAGTKAAAIQVKTRRPLGSDNGWHMKAKHEDIVGKRMFYCFVDLRVGTDSCPVVYIIPAVVVAKILKVMHRIWLREPGKKGQAHKETEMRRLLPDYSKNRRLSAQQKKMFGDGWMKKYRENWALLGLDS